jgi:glutamate-1-semialdehyde 2,1-aminomutase
VSLDDSARALRERAERVLPGGVNSPVRAFAAVKEVPPAIARGSGAYVYDTDGNRYLDYILGFGPHILGHGPPQVLDAIGAQLERGVAFGVTTALEVELAERVVSAMPSIEMVRFVNSGTEACMSALRLARAATGRNVLVKFAGGYHGHADALLTSAGSGVATLGIPGSPGVPDGAVRDTWVAPYNDAGALVDLFSHGGERVAAVIVEPVAGNIGCVPPAPGFLETIRKLTAEHGALLIFDEVITGFRLGWGGAQEHFGISADITCLGKVIGGGLPVGAYGGGRGLMERVAPRGPVYQAGTLSGNSLTMAAGCAALDVLHSGAAYSRLDALGKQLGDGLRAAAAGAGLPCAVNQIGSMVTPFLGAEEVHDFAGASGGDTELFAEVHRIWRDAGILWPPSQFETGFLSTEHSAQDVTRTVEAFATGVRGLSARSQSHVASR